jgi:hypothetical protein
MTKERIQKTTQQQEFCIRSGGGRNSMTIAAWFTKPPCFNFIKGESNE